VANIYKSEGGRQAIEAFYRKALQHWPVAHEQLRLQTSQGETFVVASGPADGPPLVMLHGSGTNSAIWMRDVVGLAKTHRVYAVDVIGEPGFSAPERPPLRSDAYATWLDDVFDRLGLARASLVGVSLGGWLALDYAIRRPSRVATLSLLSPAGIGAQNRLFLLKAGLLLLLGKWGLRRAFNATAGKAAAASPAARFVTLIFEHFRPRMDTLPIRTDQELTSLAMPVQVIVGGRDRMIRSTETRERVERLVSRLDLTFLENEGHLLPGQSGTIAAFLSSQLPGAGSSTVGVIEARIA
jgi:pimeloyl-ACP methyl ester carboxylesterase